MYNESFVQKCLNGDADLFELDDYIEEYHTTNVQGTLREYLGLTEVEYQKWGLSDDSMSFFRDILRCRREGISFEEYQGMTAEERIAARSYDADSIAKLKNGEDK